MLYSKDLAEHYLGKFVSCSDLLDDKKILIIEKNRSVKLICNNEPVGAVIRNAAKKSVLEHFGAKIKVTVKAHYALNREKEHLSSGKMAGHDYRENRTKYLLLNMIIMKILVLMQKKYMIMMEIP